MANINGNEIYFGIVGEISAGGGDIQLISSADWDELTTAQKQTYGLVAIQDTNVGYKRGDLVYGAAFSVPSLIQYGTAASSTTFQSTYSGNAQLLVIAMNSEASTYDLNISAKLNGNTLTGDTLITNPYVNYGSSDVTSNVRNYIVNIYDLSVVPGDEISIALSQASRYSSFVYAIVTGGFTSVLSALSQADRATKGSYHLSSVVVYGEIKGANGGTITLEEYEAGDVITSSSTTTGYESTYIFWLE